MTYRIFTENKNKKGIEKICNKRFIAYTIFESVGYWKGTREKSLCIEVSNAKSRSIREVAKSIKIENKQEAVLIQKIQDSNFMI